MVGSKIWCWTFTDSWGKSSCAIKGSAEEADFHNWKVQQLSKSHVVGREGFMERKVQKKFSQLRKGNQPGEFVRARTGTFTFCTHIGAKSTRKVSSKRNEKGGGFPACLYMCRHTLHDTRHRPVIICVTTLRSVIFGLKRESQSSHSVSLG